MKNNTQPIKVLIVDDEPEVATALVENLQELSDKYNAETANSGDEAIAKLKQSKYDLVLTDFKMPDMNGLQLAQAIQQLSPDTQIVLMTAYGTAEIRNMVDSLELDGYLNKPFSIDQIQGVVEQAVISISGKDPYRSGEQSIEQSVHKHLQELQMETSAHCVLLLSLGGYPIVTAGSINGLDVDSVGALVAANFSASEVLANLLSNGATFKSSYYEGPEYNVYAHDINGELILAVVFSSKGKAGTIWFYTKGTAATLSDLEICQTEAFELGDDSAEALNGEIEKLLDGGIGDKGDGTGVKKLMSIDDAVKAGLVPADLADEKPAGE